MVAGGVACAGCACAGGGACAGGAGGPIHTD